MVESSPVIDVGHPTCTTEQSSGSRKYSSVPAVRIYTFLPTLGERRLTAGLAAVSRQSLSACAQTESGAAFYEELGGKTDAPQTGGGLVVLTVPCHDVVEVALDRVPQGCGHGSGGTHALGVAIHLHAHQVLGRRAGQRVVRVSVHKLVDRVGALLALRRCPEWPEPHRVAAEQRGNCRAVLCELENVRIHQVIPIFRSSLSISAGAAAAKA